MADNLDLKIIIEANVSSAVSSLEALQRASQNIRDSMEVLNQEYQSGKIKSEEYSRSIRSLETSLVRNATAQRKITKEAERGAEAHNKQTAAIKAEQTEWDKLVAHLNRANEAYREFRRGELTGEGGGVDVKSMSNEELQKLIDIRKAQSADVVASAEKELATRKQILLTEQEMQDKINLRIQAEKLTTKLLEKQAEARRQQLITDTAAGQDHLNASNILNHEIEQRQQVTDSLRQSIQARYQETDAVKEQIDSHDKLATGSLPRERYALYDLAAAYTTFSAIALGALYKVTSAASEYQSAFAKVARTTGATGTELGSITDALRDMSTQIPESVSNLSDLAARAAQVGVASDEIAGFTETISKFVATSDTVTLDQAVESIARLANITGYRDWERLGSAITLVGVNSAATEAQIIKSAQEIAPFGKAAGMAADEIIGLAAATQSLGQAPERTRSAIQALTFSMNRAAAGANDLLPAYAKLLNLSEEATKSLWEQDPTGFIQAMARALAGVDNLTMALDELGITEKRAAQVFSALAIDAQNAGDGMSVLETSLAAANKGLEEGTELNRQFEIILNTLTSQLEIFGNIMNDITATLGGPLVEGLTQLFKWVNSVLDAFRDFVSLPGVSQFFSFIIVPALALVGVLAAVRAGMAITRASLLAYQTAMYGVSAAQMSTTSTAKLFISSLFMSRNAADAATWSVRGFGAALGKSLLAAGAIGIALIALGETIKWVSDLMSGGPSFEDYFGGIQSYTDSIAKDTAIFEATGESITTFAVKASKAADEAEDNSQKANLMKIGLEGVGEAAEDAVGGIEDLTFAIGENTKEQLINYSVQQDWFKELIENQDFVDAFSNLGMDLGVVMEEFLEAAGNEITARDFLKDMAREARETIVAELSLSEEDAEILLAALPHSFNKLLSDYEIMGIITEEQMESAINKYREVEEVVTRLEGPFSALEHVVKMASNSLTLFGGEMHSVGEESDETVDKLKVLTDSFKELMDETFGSINAANALQSALNNLGDDFYNLGGAAAFSGQNMQDAIMAIFNVDPSNAGANLQAFYIYLRDVVKASAEDLYFLEGILVRLGLKPGSQGGAPTVDFSIFDKAFSSGASGAKKMGGAARSAAKEIRTLIDYANDLKKVFDRAFNIRFGSDSTLDSIRQAWRDINREIEDAQRKINELTADRALKEYWLSVAEAYGDTLRAGVLKAEIEGIDAQISDEQAKFNKELTGTSEAAENNRARMTGLLKLYQDHLVVLAENGMSQSQLRNKAEGLRQEFLQQAQQLGYNTTEVKKYEKSFDDMVYAINQVPRRVTTSLEMDPNPAKQGLKELESAAKTAGKNIGSGIASGFKGANSEVDKLISKLKQTDKLRAAIQAGIRAVNALPIPIPKLAKNALLNTLNRALSKFGFAHGGYTGPGGMYEPKGIVHGGEYVFTKAQTNQSTGLPKESALLEMLARGRNVATPRGGGPGYANGGFVSGSNVMTVELTPQQYTGIIDELSRQIGVIVSDTQIAEMNMRGESKIARQGRMY